VFNLYENSGSMTCLHHWRTDTRSV